MIDGLQSNMSLNNTKYLNLNFKKSFKQLFKISSIYGYFSFMYFNKILKII